MPRLSGSRWSTDSLRRQVLESAYSAHVNITPTALLPVDQGKRLCVASIMSARRKGSWANRKIAFHEALYDVRVYTIMWLTPCYLG